MGELMHLTKLLWHFQNYLDWPMQRLLQYFAHRLQLTTGRYNFRSTRWLIWLWLAYSGLYPFWRFYCLMLPVMFCPLSVLLFFLTPWQKETITPSVCVGVLDKGGYYMKNNTTDMCLHLSGLSHSLRPLSVNISEIIIMRHLCCVFKQDYM